MHKNFLKIRSSVSKHLTSNAYQIYRKFIKMSNYITKMATQRFTSSVAREMSLNETKTQKSLIP